jgi:two-component system phosphate regulon sensor histidine kinase PhoR
LGLKQFAEQVAQGLPAQAKPRELGAAGDAQRALEAAVSELRRQGEARQAELSLLAAAVKSMPTGVLLLDAQGRLAFANPAAELMLQSGPLRAGQFYWESFRQIEVLEAIKASAGQDSPLTREFSVSQGVDRYLIMTVAPWSGPQGHGGSLVIFYDLSEAKKLERMRSEFASNVSHELRTPLAAIKATLETLADGAVDDKAVNRDFVGKAARQAQRLEDLVNDVLRLASAEESRRLGRVDRSAKAKLSEAYAQALQACDELLKRYGAEVSLQGQDFEVYCDPVALRQILGNLIENAAKYAGPKPSIEVFGSQQGGQARIEVTDHGPGVPEADHSRKAAMKAALAWVWPL